MTGHPTTPESSATTVVGIRGLTEGEGSNSTVVYESGAAGRNPAEAEKVGIGRGARVAPLIGAPVGEGKLDAFGATDEKVAVGRGSEDSEILSSG